MKLTLKTKKIFKTIGTLGLAALLGGSAVFLASCNEKTPDDPTKDPNKPNPPITIVDTDLENAIKDYETLVINISNATSLTSQEDDKKVEIQENKLKLTQNNSSKFVETTNGERFEYVFDGEGYVKNTYTGMLTAQTAKSALISTIDVDDWTAVDAQGKLTKTGYSAEFDKDAKTLSFTSPEHTITIYDVGQTQVTLPEVKDQVQEGFKITAENIEQIKEAFIPHIEKMDARIDMTYQEIQSIYLKKSEGSQFVDTIGAVYTAKDNQYGSTFFYWNEMKIPTQEDLTYERFYKNDVPANYKLSATKFETKYWFACKDESNYTEMTDTLKSQTFKEDYTNCQWSGWKYTQGLDSDIHTISCFKNGVIREEKIRVVKDNTNQNVAVAVEKHFKDKEESEETYQIRESNTLKVLSEDKQFLVVEEPSKQQNIENVG